VDGTVENIGEM